MKIIKQSAEIWKPDLPWEIDHNIYESFNALHLACEALGERPTQEALLRVVYKQIERASRICYTENTEVLTNCGWKYINTLTQNDKVLTYIPETNTMEYDEPNLVINDVSEKLVLVDHPQIKFCVTGNHRIYQSVPEKRKYSFLTANQIAGIDKIPNSKQNRFRIAKYFTNSKRNSSNLCGIDVVKYSKEVKHGFLPSSVETVSLPVNKDLMCLIGAYIAEGHSFHGEKYGTGSYCQITQTENTELYNDVINSLSNLKINYKIYSDPRKSYIKWIRFGNQCLVGLFEELCGQYSENKHLPIWFRELSDTYLQTLLKYLYLGDGSHNKKRHERYLSISNRLLDEIQEVFILLGKNGIVKYDNTMSQKCYFEESHRDSWIISRKKHVSKTELYTGKVYCTSTKSGIICIRVDGKTCWCGNCYKSEDKITEDSAKEFVDRLIKSNHYAMLEHGTVYLELPCNSNRILDYHHNKYSKVIMDGTTYSITTNYRVIIENHWEDDLQYICSPTEFHAKRVTVHCTTSLLVAMELLRHRVMSFAMESTRYCNYSKNKFGNELTFIQPCWNTHSPVPSGYGDTFNEVLQKVEWGYNRLIELGWLPQQAATILPKALKTELVITGFVDDWKHLFDLRVKGTTGAPHPQMVELMTPVYEEFKRLGYVTE